MKIINRSKGDPSSWSRNKLQDKDILGTVNSYKELINSTGSKALTLINNELGLKNPRSFKVRLSEISKSGDSLPDNIKTALLNAAANIEAVCKAELRSLSSEPIMTTKGVSIWKEFRSIDSVGLYIPGGTAPLVSSFLMQVIPARIAGCKNIVVCSPSNENGEIPNEILWIAKLFNIKLIYKIGGAQAILAMAYGQTMVPKVDKIFGPGNAYVDAAKRLVSNDVAIDLPAGPSEVMVVTDELNNASLAAADALSQLEHGPDSRAFVISTKLKVLNAVKKAFLDQSKDLLRQSILKRSTKNLFLVKTKSASDSVAVINQCAPEHLILLDNDYSKLLPRISSAGSVFCGSLSPESFGDYASGTNHVLPTNGSASVISGLGVKDFGKQISVQTATAEGFNNLKQTVFILADLEGLDGHSKAVSIREARAQSLLSQRIVSEIRKTNETEIYATINLDGSGKSSINTGVKFLDHLLEQLSKHSKIDMNITCVGDLEIDEHHTIEDIAITLGKALNKALGQRVGISRYSNSETLVMDEVKSSVAIDLASRRYLNFNCSPLRERVGDFPTEMFEHFFISLINEAAFTCHIETKGTNSHHLLEATFKTFARALKQSIVIEGTSPSSTKGIL